MGAARAGGLAAVAAVLHLRRIVCLASPAVSAGHIQNAAPAGAGGGGGQYLRGRYRQDAADDLAGAGLAAGRLASGRDFARLRHA